jgi:DNA mismatch repair protein MutL
MKDIIRVLPDSVANQIAAGEVIQRPASVVKELMENSIDSGAASVRLVVKDAGRTLIQVSDNGCGMSETDARLCFERHATSKISKAEDLFAIRTMGFRGEALASIAAIAHVELKTKRVGDELGTMIVIEGSELKTQEPCSCSDGTLFSVKNLFYNVPARRNFLKSNPVEMKHILEEFHRVALAQPGLSFSLHHNDTEIYQLKAGGLAQRVVGLFGRQYKEQLIQVDESTSILSVRGFVGKPEFAKKTRGEQYFFINNRYAKDAYLNHAVLTAFEGMLPEDSYPFYVLFIDIEPSRIDINIHPTKTEIKFEDERSVYAIMKSSVKRALAKYNVIPSLDFEQETTFNIPVSRMKEPPVMPGITVDTSYNPFNKSHGSTPSSGSQNKDWSRLYEGLGEARPVTQVVISQKEEETGDSIEKPVFQLHKRYIVSTVRSGMLLIDQHLAHQRILYEKYLGCLKDNQGPSQQELFPQTVEFSADDFMLVKEMEEQIKALGFDISEFGKNTYAVNGVPADVNGVSPRQVLEGLIEQFKQYNEEFKLERRNNLACSMAKNAAVKSGRVLSTEEMKAIINELFACETPNICPVGNPTTHIITLDDISRKFEMK